MSCHNCILCAGALVKFKSQTSIDIPGTHSNPSFSTDLDPLLETSAQSAEVCLESILNFWEIPSEATRQLLQSDEAEGSADLTSSLFCTSCIQRNTEILELNHQISILTERVAKLKTFVESNFWASYTNEENDHPRNDDNDGMECVIVDRNPVCKLELFLTEEDCRIQNLAKNLRLLFAQSLIGREELHVESSILIPPDTNTIDIQEGILDPLELTEDFASVQFSEDSSASTSDNDDSNTDPTFKPKGKLTELTRLKYMQSVLGRKRKGEIPENENEIHQQSHSDNLIPNTNSTKYEKKLHEPDKLEYTLPNQIQLKDARVIVEKLSSDQLAQFSKNCRPLKARRKPGPKPKPKKSPGEVGSVDEWDRFPCPIPTCGKSFLTKEDRDCHHKTMHDGITHPYICDQCGRKFHRLKLYTVHMNAHRGVFPFVCDICGHGCILKRGLIDHQRSHSDVLQFQCKLCPKEFRCPQGLAYHMRQVHMKVKPFTCHECGKCFVISSHLRRHLNSVHVKEKSRICPLCGKMFAIQNYLYMHMRMHEGKPFPSAMKYRKKNNFQQSF